MFETYGDLINSLIKEGIIRIEKCKYCGYENYIQGMIEDFYCNRCGEYHEEEQ